MAAKNRHNLRRPNREALPLVLPPRWCFSLLRIVLASTKQNAAATSADITLSADRAFYSCLDTRELVKVAQGTVGARQLLVDKVQALTNAKPRSELDLSFTKVDLARANLLLLEARNNEQSCLATLS